MSRKGKGKRLGSTPPDAEEGYYRIQREYGEHISVKWPMDVTATTFGNKGVFGCWEHIVDEAAYLGLQLILRGRDNREANRRAREKGQPSTKASYNMLKIWGAAGQTVAFYTKIRLRAYNLRKSWAGLPHPSLVNVMEIDKGHIQAPAIVGERAGADMSEQPPIEIPSFPNDSLYDKTEEDMQHAMGAMDCGAQLGVLDEDSEDENYLASVQEQASKKAEAAKTMVRGHIDEYCKLMEYALVLVEVQS